MNDQHVSATSADGVLGSFDRFYEQSLRETVEVFEEERKKASKKIKEYLWISSVLTAIGAGVLFFLFWEKLSDFFSENFDLLLVLMIPPALVFVWARDKYWMPLKMQVQKTIPEQIFAFVDPQARYKPFEQIDEENIQKSGLFKKPSRYRGEDHTRFTFDGKTCEFSEITLTWGGGKHKMSSTGVFVVAEAEREIEAPVWVWSRGERDHVKRDFKGEVVDLESPTFEKLFNVRGDQFEARRIFTPLFMHQAIELRVNKQEAVYLSYVGKQIYIYLHKKKEFIEASLFRALNKEAVRGMYEEVNDVLSTLTTLNLRDRRYDQFDLGPLPNIDQKLVDKVMKQAEVGERSVFVILLKVMYAIVLIASVLMIIYFATYWLFG